MQAGNTCDNINGMYIDLFNGKPNQNADFAHLLEVIHIGNLAV